MKTILLLAALISAQDATLEKAKGSVFIKAEGAAKYVKARAGESLLYGDSVRTGPKSIAHVVVQSGPVILVQENSSFVLTGTPSRTEARFRAGEFLIGLKEKLAKGRTFRVRTPAAVAAVRGTLFWGKINPDKSTDFAALENEIAVTAAKKTVVLKPGQKTNIPFGQAPADPAAADIPADYPKQTFSVNGSLQGLEQLLK